MLQHVCKFYKTFTTKIATLHGHFMRYQSETCTKIYRLFIEITKSLEVCKFTEIVIYKGNVDILQRFNQLS